MNRLPSIANENVVARLKQELAAARAAGLCVRMEVLEDEQASWCEIAGVPTLFVDLSLSAAEQLMQVQSAIGAYQADRRDSDEKARARSCPESTTRAA